MEQGLKVKLENTQSIQFSIYRNEEPSSKLGPALTVYATTSEHLSVHIMLWSSTATDVLQAMTECSPNLFHEPIHIANAPKKGKVVYVRNKFDVYLPSGKGFKTSPAFRITPPDNFDVRALGKSLLDAFNEARTVAKAAAPAAPEPVEAVKPAVVEPVEAPPAVAPAAPVPAPVQEGDVIAVSSNGEARIAKPEPAAAKPVVKPAVKPVDAAPASSKPLKPIAGQPPWMPPPGRLP